MLAIAHQRVTIAAATAAAHATAFNVLRLPAMNGPTPSHISRTIPTIKGQAPCNDEIRCN
eukprot:11346834-Prorocentrum_lima.AAC.1